MANKATREFLARRREVYAKTFTGPLAEEVLADLARFCRAEQSTFNPDPRVHALMEGRREVYLRIMDHVKLSEDDLVQRYAQPQNQAPE